MNPIARAAGLIQPEKVFRKFLRVIVNVLIIYIILILGVGLIKTLFSVKPLLLGEPIGKGFAQVVTDILTFLVIIELFRGFIVYFEAHRFRLHSMLDPSIVMVIRELVVHLYKSDGYSLESLVGFGVLILSLGVVRTLAVCFSPDNGEE